ncbi:hypothetical protein Aspvir_003317 [Aspergillus viridinutans]|uniref:F-box domain-containing protein n=1 Tax=Aspergillus viridinutans TaxID=75553 RepID=A0A9P3C9H3_ASPVI|nr:uncharacterized protein Aspvir_003317 [Aspergillus viridinutans]GIK07651.1 hypothetical protein Aspvir_003317 [Aspergillus viridinutans]
MDPEGIEEDYYRYEVLKDCDLGWLDKLRALGVNPEAHGNDKSFLTGSGRYWDCGGIEVAAGDDPNFPFRSDSDAVIPMTAYHDFANIGEPHVFPFHSVCYEDILQRCIRKGKSEPIKGDILFNVFEDLNGQRHVRLELSYGEPGPPAEQVWCTVKGQELLVVNPVKIPWLDADLDPIINCVDKKAGPNQHSQNQDIFNRLPSELRQEILKLLPADSILTLKAVSWTMHTTTLSPILWKDKLQREMPWLWEIGEIDTFQSQESEAKLLSYF